MSLILGADARAQHNDALIFQDGGKVQTGGVDVDCLLFGTPPGCEPTNTENVYEAELLEQGVSPGLVGFADEPGFFSPADGFESALPYGDNLPGNVGHTVDFVLAPNSPVPGASILFWDGAGPVSWSAVPSFEYFEIEGNTGSDILDGSNEIFGIELDSTSADGFFDTHPDFFLFGDGGTQDPAVGFYSIFGITNIDTLVSSDTWGIVFDFGVEDEVLHEQAIESVASILAPEPGTWAVLILGLVGLALRRRVSA